MAGSQNLEVAVGLVRSIDLIPIIQGFPQVVKRQFRQNATQIVSCLGICYNHSEFIRLTEPLILALLTLQ